MTCVELQDSLLENENGSARTAGSSPEIVPNARNWLRNCSSSPAQRATCAQLMSPIPAFGNSLKHL